MARLEQSLPWKMGRKPGSLNSILGVKLPELLTISASSQADGSKRNMSSHMSRIYRGTEADGPRESMSPCVAGAVQSLRNEDNVLNKQMNKQRK